MKKQLSRNTYIGLAIGLVVVIGLAIFLRRPEPPVDLKLTEYEQRIDDHQVKTATYLMRDSALTGELTDGTSYKVVVPKQYGDLTLTPKLLDGNVDLKIDSQQDALFTTLLYQYLPVLLLIGVLSG